MVLEACGDAAGPHSQDGGNHVEANTKSVASPLPGSAPHRPVAFAGDAARVEVFTTAVAAAFVATIHRQ